MIKKLLLDIRTRKIRIRVTIFASVAMFLIVTVTCISSAFYYASTEAIIKMADRTVSSITGRIIDNTNTIIKETASDLKVMSRSIGEGDIIASHEALWDFMWETVSDSKHVISMYIGDKDGNFVQSRKSPEVASRIVNRKTAVPYERWFYRDDDFNVERFEDKKQIYDPRTRPWYKNTTAEEKFYLTDAYVFYSSKSPGITVTYPVVSNDGTVKAVTAADILLDQLSDFIVEQKVSDNSIVFIIGENNELIAYPEIDKIIKKNEKSGEMEFTKVNDLNVKWIHAAVSEYRKSGKRQFLFKSSGVSYISTFTGFMESFGKKWTICVIIPLDDLTGQVKRMILVFIVVSAVILLLSLMLLNKMTERLSMPILRLAEQTTHIKTFDLEKVTGVDSFYKEVDIMNNSILAMKEGLLAFKKYVPSDLVKQLISTGEGAKLGGKKDELAIMFTDIANFTSISEKMEVESLMIHLSDYLSELSKVIIDSKGTIDKYIGDAIMSFWGAPVRIDNPSVYACEAALQCLKKLETLNEKWKSEGKPQFFTRIGIHTGDVIIGNVGSDERLNYSVIGDSVNLASRLEGANKNYHTGILISESTYKYVKDDFFCKVVDKVAVTGKQNGVMIYNLLGSKRNYDQFLDEVCNLYEKAFALYQAGDFKGAYKLYRKSWEETGDKTSKLMANRCAIFSRNGVPENWNGIWVMTHK